MTFEINLSALVQAKSRFEISCRTSHQGDFRVFGVGVGPAYAQRMENPCGVCGFVASQ